MEGSVILVVRVMVAESVLLLIVVVGRTVRTLGQVGRGHVVVLQLQVLVLVQVVVLQKVPSEANPKVCNHGEGPY